MQATELRPLLHRRERRNRRSDWTTGRQAGADAAVFGSLWHPLLRGFQNITLRIIGEKQFAACRDSITRLVVRNTPARNVRCARDNTTQNREHGARYQLM